MNLRNINLKSFFQRPITLDKIIFYISFCAFGAFVFFLFWFNSSFEVVNSGNNSDQVIQGNVSSLTGESCEKYNKRPVAIMMAADPSARPLTGISQADMIFEMPVTPGAIPRFMAVFQCGSPKEIGSIRSAREDFVPLAAGLGALYAHWGGERDALEKLNSKIIENIDALKYDGTVFYRKKGVKPPHNGFTTLDNIYGVSEKLNYSLENKFEGYPRDNKNETSKSLSNISNVIDINYPEPYNVRWVYDSQTSSYKRYRGGEPEIDKEIGNQVSVPVVVVMETRSKDLNKDYIAVETKGSGPVKIYQGGFYTSGTWKKNSDGISGKLYFYDDKNNEIKLRTGKIWIQIKTEKIL